MPSNRRPKGLSRPVRALLALAAALATATMMWWLIQPAEQPETLDTSARPALWRIADNDTTIYLFGTVHSLPDGVRWRTPAIERAIDASDSLVLEIADGATVDELSLFRAMASDEPTGGPLTMRIDRELSPALAETVAKTGLRRLDLDAMESWAAALAIANALGAQAGFKSENGVEASLDARFRSNAKSVTGLETSQGQLQMFDALPDSVQRLMLERAIASHATAADNSRRIVAAWAKGDVDTIATIVTEDLGRVEGLAAPLLHDRNAIWVRALAQRLEKPGTVFVAVGAAHLATDKSVQALLARQTGLALERLQ